jgi:hypothetical protein
MAGAAGGTVAAIKRAGAPGRAENDFYRTPEKATVALLRVERFHQHVTEPACGDGAISEVLRCAGYTVFSTDLIDRGYGIPGCDFLASGPAATPSLVTNPPFNLIDRFLLHALDSGFEKVAFFARTAWVEGGKRYDNVWSKYPPIRIWQFSSRQTLWRGDDPDPRTVGGAIAFAWFIFERGFNGDPALKWLR